MRLYPHRKEREGVLIFECFLCNKPVSCTYKKKMDMCLEWDPTYIGRFYGVHVHVHVDIGLSCVHALDCVECEHVLWNKV